VEAIWERVRDLGARLRAQLAELDGVTVRDVGEERCAIVTFDVAEVPADRVMETLRHRGINVSVSATSSAMIESLERGLPDLVRASPHYYNTDEELDRLVESVRIAARC
jgi:cysteine desulfurase/selenocysteine lyase